MSFDILQNTGDPFAMMNHNKRKAFVLSTITSLKMAELHTKYNVGKCCIEGVGIQRLNAF